MHPPDNQVTLYEVGGHEVTQVYELNQQKQKFNSFFVSARQALTPDDFADLLVHISEQTERATSTVPFKKTPKVGQEFDASPNTDMRKFQRMAPLPG